MDRQACSAPAVSGSHCRWEEGWLLKQKSDRKACLSFFLTHRKDLTEGRLVFSSSWFWPRMNRCPVEMWRLFFYVPPSCPQCNPVKITHLCVLQQLGILALRMCTKSFQTSWVESSWEKQPCREHEGGKRQVASIKKRKERKKPPLHSAARSSLVSVPSRPVISGVNEVGMLSVTGYSRARPRGTELERALHNWLEDMAGALTPNYSVTAGTFDPICFTASHIFFPDISNKCVFSLFLLCFMIQLHPDFISAFHDKWSCSECWTVIGDKL